jgi:hypothetical protein
MYQFYTGDKYMYQPVLQWLQLVLKSHMIDSTGVTRDLKCIC